MASELSSQPSNPFAGEMVVDQGAPRSRTGCRCCAVALSGGMLAAMLLGGAIHFTVQRSTPAALLTEETREEKVAEVTAAYASQNAGVPEQERLAIERLMEAIASAGRRDDWEQFAALVDYDRMFGRVWAKASARGVNWVRILAVRVGLNQSDWDPTLWQRGIIRRVRMGPNGKSALVYTHFFDDEESCYEIRWWIERDGEGWKISDWERLDLGKSEADFLAIYAERLNDRRLDNYFEFDATFTAAINMVSAGDTEGAAEQLRLCEAITVLPELNDYKWVLVGYGWNQCGAYDPAREAFDRVQDPEGTPGAYFGSAVAYFDEGEHAAAIEVLNQYEQLVGPVPDACALKAEALESLGRTDEAVVEFGKSLQGNPSDADALQSLATLLGEHARDELAPYLLAADDPAETAADLARRLDLWGEHAVISVLAEFLQERFAQTGQAAFVEGLVHRSARRNEDAAQRFLEAFQRAALETDQVLYFRDYMTAMVDALQTVEAYRAAPDPREAFRYLMSLYESDMVSDDEARRLLEAHRLRVPDDPLIPYYAGMWLVAHGSLENAIAQFTRATDLLPEDDPQLDAVREAHAAALQDAGRCLEAYAIPPSAARFEMLAQRCERLRRFGDLRRLLEAHRAAGGEGAELEYYEAALLVHEGAWEEAAERLEMMEQNGFAEYATRQLRLRVALETGRWKDAYAQCEAPDTMFGDLARIFRAEQRWDDLRALIELRRATRPDDAAAAAWDIERLWSTGDFASVVAQGHPLPETVRDGLDDYRLDEIRQYVLRSLLKCRRNEAAGRLAKSMYDESGRSLAMLLYHVSVGEVDATARYLAEYRDTEGFLFDCFDDPDIGARLRSPEFAPLRESFPIELPLEMGIADTVLLVREHRALDATRLTSRLSDVLGTGAQVTALPEQAGFLVRRGDVRVAVAAHAGAYPAKFSSRLESGSLQTAVEQHQGWLGIAGIGWGPADEQAVKTAVDGVVGALIDENSLAIYLPTERRLLEVGEPSRRLFAGELPRRERFQLGEEISAAPQVPADSEAARRFAGELARFVEAVQRPRDEPQEFLVEVRLPVDVVGAFCTISVEKVEREGGQFRFVGSLVGDSLLVPGLSAGERMRVEELEVVACHYREGGVEHSFRR